MCGISGIVGVKWHENQLADMIRVQHHRGPNSNGKYISKKSLVGLGHNRLSIIDLSDAGQQPMQNEDGSLTLVFNGEVYNYKELYSYFPDYKFISKTDSEVVLAAYQKWGENCLDYLIGMFAFAIWDEKRQRLFCARDRFGVKPFYYGWQNDNFLFASEIKALHAAGIPPRLDESTWATYLTYGLYDHGENTFWKDIKSLEPGHYMVWQNSKLSIRKWYALEEKIQEGFDERLEEDIREEYLSLLQESIRLRFRADVQVGISLSGGLDSSILLGLVDQFKGKDNKIVAFTFATGDENYDETPWAKAMLAHTQHPHEVVYLSASEIPDLAIAIQQVEDEPFGGFPTLAYSKVFQRAKQMGIMVILDGQGMDEQWAGYEYYYQYLGKEAESLQHLVAGPVQASKYGAFRTDCLTTEFAKQAVPVKMPTVFPDALRNVQYRDAFVSKIPRALRFNDRISMQYSTELREPFLDHRLFELAFRQKEQLKIRNGSQKWLVRTLVGDLLPVSISEAPKRPLQTPQREWLKGPLKNWATECIQQVAYDFDGSWFEKKRLFSTWNNYVDSPIDNSFFVWQWISLAMINQNLK